MEDKQEQEVIISTTPEMTAGQMLRMARTTGRRKREIATISKLLCIREEFLTALEEGNYRVIPEDVYILGFARSYAVELGLDPDEVIAKLKRELGLIPEEKEEEEEPEEEIDEEEQPQTPNANKFLQYMKKNWKWFVASLLIVVLVFVLVTVLNKESTDTVVEPEIPVVVNTEVDFRYPVREKFNVKNSGESRVVLQAEKECWIKIEDARGNTEFSRVLVPGDVYYLPVDGS